ncbi:hypothetical protein RYX36_012758 [Vicia faba]
MMEMDMESLYWGLGYEEGFGPGKVSSSYKKNKSINTRAIDQHWLSTTPTKRDRDQDQIPLLEEDSPKWACFSKDAALGLTRKRVYRPKAFQEETKIHSSTSALVSQIPEFESSLEA